MSKKQGEKDGQIEPEIEKIGKEVSGVQEKTMAQTITERVSQPPVKQVMKLETPKPQVLGILSYTKVMVNGNVGINLDIKGEFSIEDLLNISSSLRQAAVSQKISGPAIEQSKNS